MLSLRGCRGTDEVRALVAVFILLLALVPAGSKYPRKTIVWITPCKAQDVNPLVRGRSREADHEEMEVVGRNNRPSPRPLRRLRTQAANTFIHFNGIRDVLPADLCNKILEHKMKGESDITLRGLPDNPLRWYKKKVKCLDKKGKVKQILPRLREGLQRYLASMERLRDPHFNLLLKSNCRYHREKRLEMIEGKMAQLLCEVDKCFRDLGIDKPPGLGGREGKKLFQSESIDQDITSAHLFEATVLTRYSEFIKEWNRIVRHVVGKNGFKQCTHSY